MQQTFKAVVKRYKRPAMNWSTRCKQWHLRKRVLAAMTQVLNKTQQRLPIWMKSRNRLTTVQAQRNVPTFPVNQFHVVASVQCACVKRTSHHTGESSSF